MEISPRKEELTAKHGWIESKIINGYEKLWILNTSCYRCLLEFSCYYLRLSRYHSIVFTSSFNLDSSDATLRNYSACPYQFVARTDDKGFYFVYFNFYYSRSRDYFNLSYSVIDNDRLIEINQRKQVFNDTCFEISSKCSYTNETKVDRADNSRCILYDDISVFGNRFMHASVQVGSSLYVHGGLSSRNITNRLFIRFSGNIWEKVTDSSRNRPPCLYSHSMSYYQTNNELIIFGGFVCHSKMSLTGIIWIFSINTGIWQQIYSASVKPVIGHTSHIYKDIMFVFFGLTYSPHIGYGWMTSIQRFNLNSRLWIDEISELKNIPLIGFVYHCSFQFGDQVWIFGALFPPILKKLDVSSRLLIFNLATSEWKILSDHGPSLYLHSCLVINSTFISIGGLKIKEKELPFSSSVYYYNPHFSEWGSKSIDLTCMGHGMSVTKSNSVVIIGGKSSAFLSDLTYLSLENCAIFSKSRSSAFKPFVAHRNTFDTRFFIMPERHCNYYDCHACVSSPCIWCALTNQCVSKLQFDVCYTIGCCEGPIFYESTCPINCEDLTNSGCANCTELSFCGWCEFRTTSDVSEHLSGFGKCVNGSIDGPAKSVTDLLVTSNCHRQSTLENWYYLQSQCLSCNCNGHAACATVHSYQSNLSKELSTVTKQCSTCRHNTLGNNCQDCKDGYQGSAVNGQICTVCKCVKNEYAGSCRANGLCDEFCIEKGRLGNYCEECDSRNNFTHFRNMCVFKAKTNFRYILDKRTDNFNKYTNKVHFLLSDLISNMDLNFNIRCTNGLDAMIKVELYNESNNSVILMKDKYCLGFETLFQKSLFPDQHKHQLLFTVSGFQNASSDLFKLEMMFSQKSYVNLPYIFISFFACLSLSVLSFYAVFKWRQHINRRDRNYRPLLVMERPFAKIQLAVHQNEDSEEINHSVATSSFPLRTINNSNNSASIINDIHYPNIPIVCVEPYRVNDSHGQSCSDDSRSTNNNVIVSVLFVSPKCTSLTQSQQSNPRIMIGSTITKLTKIDRKMMLKLPSKVSSANGIMVDRDFDTSVSPSAAEELVTTEV